MLFGERASVSSNVRKGQTQQEYHFIYSAATHKLKAEQLAYINVKCEKDLSFVFISRGFSA